MFKLSKSIFSKWPKLDVEQYGSHGVISQSVACKRLKKLFLEYLAFYTSQVLESIYIIVGPMCPSNGSMPTHINNFM